MNAPARAATCGELPRARSIHGSTNMNWPCTAAVRLLALISASVLLGVVRLQRIVPSSLHGRPARERLRERPRGLRRARERKPREPGRLEVEAVDDGEPGAREPAGDRLTRV